MGVSLAFIEKLAKGRWKYQMTPSICYRAQRGDLKKIQAFLESLGSKNDSTHELTKEQRHAFLTLIAGLKSDYFLSLTLACNESSANRVKDSLTIIKTLRLAKLWQADNPQQNQEFLKLIVACENLPLLAKMTKHLHKANQLSTQHFKTIAKFTKETLQVLSILLRLQAANQKHYIEQALSDCQDTSCCRLMVKLNEYKLLTLKNYQAILTIKKDALNNNETNKLAMLHACIDILIEAGQCSQENFSAITNSQVNHKALAILLHILMTDKACTPANIRLAIRHCQNENCCQIIFNLHQNQLLTLENLNKLIDYYQQINSVEMFVDDWYWLDPGFFKKDMASLTRQHYNDVIRYRKRLGIKSSETAQEKNEADPQTQFCLNCCKRFLEKRKLPAKLEPTKLIQQLKSIIQHLKQAKIVTKPRQLIDKSLEPLSDVIAILKDTQLLTANNVNKVLACQDMDKVATVIKSLHEPGVELLSHPFKRQRNFEQAIQAIQENNCHSFTTILEGLSRQAQDQQSCFQWGSYKRALTQKTFNDVITRNRPVVRGFVEREEQECTALLSTHHLCVSSNGCYCSFFEKTTKASGTKRYAATPISIASPAQLSK